MRYRLWSVLSAVGVLCISAEVFSQHTTLTVKVDGITVGAGSLMIGVHDTAETFLSDTAFREVVLPVSASKSVQFEITDMPPGEYAICLFHDVNDNGRLDKSFLGFPNEPYGFSNDARGRFGPPRYADAKFFLEAGSAALSILLR